MSPRIRELDSQRGFSLVELAVYIALLGVIAAVVATVLVSLFKSEGTVSGLTTSTSDAQNAVTVLQNDIRNARQFRSSADGRTLVASVADAGAAGSWRCVRWSVTGSGAAQQMEREVKAASGWPATATPLLRGVSENGSDRFFNGSTDAGMRGELAYSMQVATEKDGAIEVAGGVSNTAQGSGSDANCFP